MINRKPYYLSLLLLGLPLHLLASAYENIAPKPPEYYEENKEKSPLEQKETPSDEDSVLVESLKHIAVFSVEVYENYSRKTADTPVSILGLALTDKNKKNLEEKLSDGFIGKPITKALLNQIRRFISDYYISINRPIVIVELPEQDITDGDLTIVVTESRLGKIHYIGNKAFPSSRYEKYMREKEGEIIESDTLLSDLAWINRNPFRYASAMLSPGEAPGTTDIDLYIKDARPIRGYAGFDNTGIEEIESHRFFAGFNWGNVFNSDHTLSYQFTSSLDFKQFIANSLSYSAPLPWRHIITAFGGYSQVHAQIKGSTMQNHGKSGQASLRYDIPIRPDGKATQSISFGGDFKRLNNTLDLGGIAISNFASLLQFMLGYQYSLKAETYSNAIEVEFFGSPGSFIPDMTKPLYSQLRQGANIRYLYGRTSFLNIWFLPKEFEIHTTIKGQLATGRLLPSEQFGLGGLYTVRGYRERIVNADNALLVSLEGHMPPWKFFKRDQGKLTPIAFIDFGLGGNPSVTPSNPPEISYLLGFGPGFKFQVSEWLFFKGFFGYQSLKVGSGDGAPYRFSFSGYVSF